MLGPFNKIYPLFLNGLEVFYQPCFSIPRKDKPDDFRLIHNFSAEDNFGISYNTLQLNNFVSMPTFRNLAYVALKSRAKFFTKLDISKGFKNVHMHPSRMRLQGLVTDLFSFVDATNVMGKSDSPQQFCALTLSICIILCFWGKHLFTFRTPAGDIIPLIHVFMDDFVLFSFDPIMCLMQYLTFMIFI